MPIRLLRQHCHLSSTNMIRKDNHYCLRTNILIYFLVTSFTFYLLVYVINMIQVHVPVLFCSDEFYYIYSSQEYEKQSFIFLKIFAFTALIYIAFLLTTYLLVVFVKNQVYFLITHFMWYVEIYLHVVFRMICYRAHCSFQYLCLQYKPYLHTINCFSFTIIELHIFNYGTVKRKKNLAHILMQMQVLIHWRK